MSHDNALLQTTERKLRERANKIVLGWYSTGNGFAQSCAVGSSNLNTGEPRANPSNNKSTGERNR